MHVMGATKFERFFRAAAALEIDNNDLKRYSDFVHQKIYDLVLIGQAHAKARGRDLIEPADFPITKGLQECIHDFHDIDEEIELQPILTDLAARPPLDPTLSEPAEAALPEVAGGISVALARAFRILEPDRRNPQTDQWRRAERVFNLLL